MKANIYLKAYLQNLIPLLQVEFPREMRLWEMFLKKLLLNSLCVLRKACITERNLSKVTLAMLLKSLSVNDNFVEVLPEFNKNIFEHKKQFKGCFYSLLCPSL